MFLAEFDELMASLEADAGIPVWHYEAEQEKFPYLVYFEYCTRGLSANNAVVAEYDMVQISFFTKDNRDLGVAAIKKLLNENQIPYEKKQFYEHGAKVHHHVFDCSLI